MSQMTCDNHGCVVVYEKGTWMTQCPVCKLDDKIKELEDKIKELEDKAFETETERDDLRAELKELNAGECS